MVVNVILQHFLRTGTKGVGMIRINNIYLVGFQHLIGFSCYTCIWKFSMAATPRPPIINTFFLNLWRVSYETLSFLWNGHPRLLLFSQSK